MKNIINILLVEDSDTDAEIVKRALCKTVENSCHIERAENMNQAEDILRSTVNINIILLDLGLPDTAGRMDTFERLENANTKNVPTLILTSINDRELAIDIVGCGAEDYVRKSCISKDPEFLLDAIEFALCRHKKIDHLYEDKSKKLEEKNLILHCMGGGYSVYS